MNRVAKIEQVQNGYVVTSPYIPPLPPDYDPFFDTFEEMIAYLRFCFDVKEKEK